MLKARKNVEPEGSASEAVTPDFVERDGGFDVAKAVFSNLSEALLRDKLRNIHTRDAVAFGGFDAESLAVEVEVKTTGSAIPATTIKGELVGKVAMGIRLVAITQPI